MTNVVNKLKEIGPEQPDYEPEASSFSKTIVVTFIISFLYLAFTNSNRVNWMGATIFLFAGLFVSSIMIAMPFFMVKRIFPKISGVVVIASMVTTFYITKIVFNWSF